MRSGGLMCVGRGRQNKMKTAGKQEGWMIRTADFKASADPVIADAAVQTEMRLRCAIPGAMACVRLRLLHSSHDFP